MTKQRHENPEVLRDVLERVLARAATTSHEPLLSPRDVARALSCSIRHARRLMNDQEPVRVGRLVRWRRAQLAAFLETGGVDVVRGVDRG